ncbi:MAG TPA: hypothetical protein PKA06_15045 [Gemmatales bacterium]|nr:hypothetical protein [Gemmatales bacterium]HMP15627.1 hypothetical protein [Gemmatales bacterium]
MTATSTMQQLQSQWTDKYVSVAKGSRDYLRFEGVVGRVITVNANLRCLVDFQDGGWYDVQPDDLEIISDQDVAATKYLAKKNSAQRYPARQA